jgi:peptidoglycan DL-endopeptidase CwlO
VAALSPTFRRHAAVTACLVSALGFTLGLPTSGSAAPKPTEAELRKDLVKLNKKVDKLIEAYAAKRESLKKAQKAEGVARENLRKAEKTYIEAKGEVDSIVQLRYQSNSAGLPPMLLFSGDMSGAALMEQLTAQQSAYLAGFAQSRDRRRQAADKAAELTEDIREETGEVEGEREDAEKLIKDIKKKLDQLVPLGSGLRSDGSWTPQLPTGADNITDRTRNMREIIKRRFDLAHVVGCYRYDTFGEHPLGRACDFMMSSGGAMPSAAGVRLGDEIAAWAVKNKSKLGVKYVIWRQRINHGSGWRSMSDRGGVTANHYDHVHISMY